MTKFPFAVAIMAGGKSTRMGRDKALLETGHVPNLERLVQLAQTCARRSNQTDIAIMVVGREKPTQWPFDEVIFIPDDIPEQGPLGGVVTALGHADTIICLACDFFALEVESLLWLINQAIGGVAPSSGLVVRHAAGIEPLFAVYTAENYNDMRQRLHSGERALHRFISASTIKLVDAPNWIVPQLININTPEEWELFQKKSQQKQSHIE